MTEPTPIATDTEDRGQLTAAILKTSNADTHLQALQQEVRDLRKALVDAGVRERALTYELQHRVRNVLAVIRTIYRRMLGSKTAPGQFAAHFEDRLDAIARYQADIAGVTAGGVELEDMVRDELLTVHCTDGPGCTISGPSVRLSTKWVELMGLALHELAINAVKFGALAHDGALHIEWTVSAEESQSILHFHWRESGVPLIATAPRVRGFGQDLIEDALPYQFGATTSFTLRPGGLDCTIILPLPTGQMADARPDWLGALNRSDIDDIG